LSGRLIPNVIEGGDVEDEPGHDPGQGATVAGDDGDGGAGGGGYDALSMLSIAKRAGASNETLHAWFGNKGTAVRGNGCPQRSPIPAGDRKGD